MVSLTPGSCTLGYRLLQHIDGDTAARRHIDHRSHMPRRRFNHLHGKPRRTTYCRTKMQVSARALCRWQQAVRFSRRPCAFGHLQCRRIFCLFFRDDRRPMVRLWSATGTFRVRGRLAEIGAPGGSCVSAGRAARGVPCGSRVSPGNARRGLMRSKRKKPPRLGANGAWFSFPIEPAYPSTRALPFGVRNGNRAPESLKRSARAPISAGRSERRSPPGVNIVHPM